MKKNNDLPGKDYEAFTIHLKEAYFNTIETTTDNLIRYCRYMQKEYVENDSETSGLDILFRLMQGGTITLDMYGKLLAAIENYTVDYTLTINLDEEE